MFFARRMSTPFAFFTRFGMSHARLVDILITNLYSHGRAVCSPSPRRHRHGLHSVLWPKKLPAQLELRRCTLSTRHSHDRVVHKVYKKNGTKQHKPPCCGFCKQSGQPTGTEKLDIEQRNDVVYSEEIKAYPRKMMGPWNDNTQVVISPAETEDWFCCQRTASVPPIAPRLSRSCRLTD